jgi:hypothetical protein
MPNAPVGTPTGVPEPTAESGTEYEKHPAQKWPGTFWILEWVELILVLCIAAFIVGLAIYLSFWIICGFAPEIHARLIATIKGVNTGWKVALLILIPLFFRPVFKFVFYMRKGPFGSESQVQEIGKPSGGYGTTTGNGTDA